MDFSYSIWWALAGIAIFITGLVLTRFYKQIADNLGSGVVSYNRFKYVGIGVTVAGLVIFFNLHTLVLDLIAHIFFGSMIN